MNLIPHQVQAFLCILQLNNRPEKNTYVSLIMNFCRGLNQYLHFINNLWVDKTMNDLFINTEQKSVCDNLTKKNASITGSSPLPLFVCGHR